MILAIAIVATWMFVAVILLPVGRLLDIDWVFLAGVGMVLGMAALVAAAAVVTGLVNLWMAALA